MNSLDALLNVPRRWRGTNVLYVPPQGTPDASPSELTVVPMLGRRFVRLDYTWQFDGQAQEGSLLLGADPFAGEVTGHWIDSWHMGRAVMALAGTDADCARIRLQGSYAAPPGPDWGWRIALDVTQTSLTLSMTNIFPDGREQAAVEAGYEAA